MVGNKNSFHLTVFGIHKPGKKKEKASGQVFFHQIHGTGSIHHAEYDRIGFLPDVPGHVTVNEIVVVKGKSNTRLLFLLIFVLGNPAAKF